MAQSAVDRGGPPAPRENPLQFRVGRGADRQQSPVARADLDPGYCESCGGIPHFLWDGHLAYAYQGCDLVP